MALVSTGLTLPGIKGEFFERFNSTPTVFQDLSTRIQSTTSEEKFRFLGSVPPMREWGTGRLARGMVTEEYSIKNLKYEATLEVDRDEISDDMLGQIKMRIAELAERAATHKDYLLAGLLVNGASAGFNSYDGVPFFNAGHVSGNSGTQTNLVGASAATPTAATTAEFQTAMRAAIAKLLSLKDDQGLPMNQSASGLVAVVPPDLLMTALEATSATVVGTTSNVLQGAARVLSFSHLTNAAKWYLLKTDVAVRPFIFQDREPIEFKALEADSEGGFRREVYEYGVRARYRMTYGYWQRAVEVTFS